MANVKRERVCDCGSCIYHLLFFISFFPFLCVFFFFFFFGGRGKEGGGGGRLVLCGIMALERERERDRV